LFLVSRLKARLDTVGSTVYEQTWREKVTPAGTVRWAHTARARTTKDSVYTGWPTPESHNAKSGRSVTQHEGRLAGGPGSDLHWSAQMATWPTECQLTAQASIIGPEPSGFTAATASTAGFQLSPAFSLWLQGFPTTWHDAGVYALRSLREPEMPLSPK
jgi:hypothetical protein